MGFGNHGLLRHVLEARDWREGCLVVCRGGDVREHLVARGAKAVRWWLGGMQLADRRFLFGNRSAEDGIVVGKEQRDQPRGHVQGWREDDANYKKC